MTELLKKFFDFRRGELPVVLLLFSFFFLAIAVFQMLRPLSRGLFVDAYGADVELYLRLLNIGAAMAGLWMFSALYNRLQRQRMVYVICAFFVAAFIALILLLRDPGAGSIWGFYMLVDLETTMMVAAFWAYATDISTSEQAKRLFGAVGAGGVLGGLLGASYAVVLLQAIGMEGILLSSAVLMSLIAAVTWSAERLVGTEDVFGGQPAPRSRAREAAEVERKSHAALEGAHLALRSKYLLAIVGLMTFYEIASQVMNYQYSSMTEEIVGVAATQAFRANVNLLASLLSVVVQLLLVSLIMRKLGLVSTLLVMPLAITLSSLSFLAFPTLLVSGLLMISDNGLNYSIQQTGRETLYIVTSPDEKYKARAFTNMVVQRAAKGIAILAVIGLGAAAVPLRYLSLLTIAMMLAMIFSSVYAGRRFREMNDEIDAAADQLAA